MPEPQDEDRCVHDFVTHLIITNDDSPDLGRRIGLELLADSRIFSYTNLSDLIPSYPILAAQ